MTMRSLVTGSMLAAALLALSACGNDSNTAQPLKIFAQFGQSLLGDKNAGPVAISDQQIATAFAATQEPIILARLVDLETEALMLRIETNGEYETFATSARQVLTLRDGLVSSSRGIGGDLMSSEPQALLAQLRSGEPGQVPYVMRFLRGDDVTISTRYTCSITRAGSERVARGAINVEGRRMNAACTSDAGSFNTGFVLDQSGTIIRSEQFLGDFIGRVVVQTLRR